MDFLSYDRSIDFNLYSTPSIDVEKVKIDFPEMSEESDEDELDVSGIVRMQSFEKLQNFSSDGAEGRQSDRDKDRGRSRDGEEKRSVQSSSSSSSSGRRAQGVGSTEQPITVLKAKVSSVASSSRKRMQEQEREGEGAREREGEREWESLGSPAARRDKAVSFEQSSTSHSSSTVPASKPLTAQGQRQHSPDKKQEIRGYADGNSFFCTATIRLFYPT